MSNLVPCVAIALCFRMILEFQNVLMWTAMFSFWTFALFLPKQKNTGSVVHNTLPIRK